MALAPSFTFSPYSPSPSLTINQTDHDFLKSCLQYSSFQKCRYTRRLRRNLSSQAAASPSISDKVLSDIQEFGVIACLRANGPELAWEAASAALNGGVTVLEIVMSTPGVLEVLQHLVLEYPGKTIGVGTVLHARDARDAIECGAKFLMSPAIVKDVMDYVSGTEVLYIPGVMTPTEILSACAAGAKVVKVYPISAVGGSKYISAVKKMFPHIPLVASQGIKLDFIEEYIAQGAAAVVLSDAIFQKQAMDERNFKVIYQLANTAALQAHQSVERDMPPYLNQASCWNYPRLLDEDDVT